jgi:hypothetical protein
MKRNGIKDFIGTHVIYDTESCTIFGVNGEEEWQPIVDLRGFGAIQNMLKNKDGSVALEKAYAFHNELGEWIADAINQKLNSQTI